MLRGWRMRWRVVQAATEAETLARALHVAPLIAQLLCNRGMNDTERAGRFFQPSLKHLHDPMLLPGCAKAAQRIVEALKSNQRIVIYGDYDVDGVTATAILFHMLRTCKPDAEVQRYVPHRIDEGYGINAEAVAQLADGGAQLIISVDCGITAVEPANVARQRGVELIITDHHELPHGPLPDAYAIVHPGLESEYPFADLCGAGVAYKLAWQIARTWCGTENVSEIFRGLLVDLLSLAALGTIADVVPLTDENRVIAHYGLGRIKRTPWEGLNALIDASKLRDEKIDAYHVGFVLGPRLNACGRMGHAKEACKLLTTAAGEEAAKIAQLLNLENQRRQRTEREIFAQARQMVSEHEFDRADARAIVLADPGWHPGVVGIVCSRLVEAFGRPVILLNNANGLAQGSGRSVEGFNLHEALVACASHLTGFGGHAMAAGLKVEAGKIDAFRDAFVAYANEKLSVDDLVAVLDIDATVTLDQLDQGAVEQLERLAPFGRGNRQPVLLVEGVRITQPPRTVGREGKHLTLVVEQDRHTMRMIGWSMGELMEQLAAGQTVDLAIRPKLNHWNGRTSVEAEIVDLRVVGQDELDVHVDVTDSVMGNIEQS